MVAVLRTTEQAAEAAGVSFITLRRWFAAGKVTVPKLSIRNGRATRLWTVADISRLKAEKERVFRLGQGKKKKAKK